MPNIRIHIRIDAPLTTPRRFSSRRQARHAISCATRHIEASPAWLRGFNAAVIQPARQAGAYTLHDYYALTGLSPRLERHYNVALGI